MKKLFSGIALVLLLFSSLGSQPAIQAQAPGLTEVFSDDFSTDKGWTDLSGGFFYRDTTNQWLVWQTRRSYPRRYYIPISVDPANVELDFQFMVTSASGNGSVYVGLVENLDAPTNVWGSEATGFFLGLNSDTSFGKKIAVLSIYSDGTMQAIGSSDSTLNYGSFNVWRKVSVKITNTTWDVTLKNLSDSQLGHMTGQLNQAHADYNYLMVFLEVPSGWETEAGYLDNIAVRTLQNDLVSFGAVNRNAENFPCGPVKQFMFLPDPPIVDYDFQFSLDNYSNYQSVYMVVSGNNTPLRSLSSIAVEPGKYVYHFRNEDVGSTVLKSISLIIDVVAYLATHGLLSGIGSTMFTPEQMVQNDIEFSYGTLEYLVLRDVHGTDHRYPIGTRLATIHDQTFWKGKYACPNGEPVCFFLRCDTSIITVASPVDIAVTDDQGRRAGAFDTGTPIPNCYYTGEASEPEGVIVFKPQAAATFSSTFTGTGNGTYDSVIANVTADVTRSSSTVLDDIPISISEVHSYQLQIPRHHVWLSVLSR